MVRPKTGWVRGKTRWHYICDDGRTACGRKNARHHALLVPQPTGLIPPKCKICVQKLEEEWKKS